MKVVILAAGIGSRLGENEQPKTLTSLANGESILGLQLKTLAHFISPSSINIVVGYHKEHIFQAFPNYSYTLNLDYSKENTSKSLLKAIDKIDDSVLWLNGDVVFHPSVIEAALKSNRTRMIVNKGSVGEEEVKYRADAKGRILEVSKQVKDAQGEALGINFFQKSDLSALKANLKACKPNDYFEKAIEASIQSGTAVWGEVVPSDLCCEIDFPADLDKANKLISSWK